MKSNRLMKAILASVFVLGASTAAVAQANSLEVAAGGGWASYHANGNSANKGKFDASVSYNLLNNLAVGFEYGFSPLQSENESGGGYTITATEHLNSYGAVARFGLVRTPRMQPYVLFAGGGVRDTVSADVSGGGQQGSASDSKSGGYFGFGGGLNAKLGGDFGFRPEVRYQRVSVSGSHLNEIDVTGSIVYRFGGLGH